VQHRVRWWLQAAPEAVVGETLCAPEVTSATIELQDPSAV
jgi:hypothetical protein